MAQPAKDDLIVGDLQPAQIEEILRAEVVGRLGCHANGRTYVVPISYAYSEGALFIQSERGLKIELMRQNPLVCFQVDRIKDLANWQSVIVWGRFRELEGREAHDGLAKIRSRLASLEASGSHPPPAETYPAEGGDHRPESGGREAVIGRIDLIEKTGRFERR